MSHIYCPECGFQNPGAANYCARCGAHLVKEEQGDSTQAFAPVEHGEESALLAEELGIQGPALVVRSGGGRAGETFTPQGDRTTIGRSPDCGIFLDDVTVSRRHAVLVEEDGSFVIQDQESLNGTFVNKERIEQPTRLEDGDEVQIGKYRLTFLSR